MDWEEFNNSIIENKKSGEQVLREFSKLQRRYKDDIHHFNYPCKVFYVSTSLYWITEQMKDFFGKSMPFVYGLIKDGKVSMELPLHIGSAEIVMKEIEAKRDEYIKEDKQKIARVNAKFEKWLKSGNIEKNKSMDYYLEELDEACRMLLETQIYFQISLHVDELLRRKIVKLFPNNKENEILKLCVSDKKADVNVHDDKVIDFVEWLKKNNFKLTAFNLINEKIKQKISECYESGYFLHSSYGGVTLWSLENEFNEIKERIKEGIPKPNETKLEKIDLNDEQKFWIRISKYFSSLRDQRKSIQQKSFYYQALLLQKISTLCGIPRNDLENVMVYQIKNLINDKKKLKEIIKKQNEGFLFCWTEHTPMYIETSLSAVNTFDKFKVKFEEKQQEISGQVACQGVAQGRVRLIFNTHQKFTFNEGDVLVTGMTSPDFVPLMRKASAIVTDLGGITCHAAIISREFGKPCIVGTISATRVLKDGDLVEVDANEGIVRKLKNAS